MKIDRYITYLILLIGSCFFSEVQASDLSGAVHIDGCSGALVRFDFSQSTDQAFILSAGHCAPARIEFKKYIYHAKYKTVVTFLKADGSDFSKTVTTAELIYATMTDSDIALYSLNQSYAQIEKEFGIKPLRISSEPAKRGDVITILSGQLHKSYSCFIENVVYSLVEGDYIWLDSIRYSQTGCEVVGGTSGSPIINPQTKDIIGINNTGNTGGKACESGSPCEISKAGSIFAKAGTNYGQQVYILTTCFDQTGRFNLNVSGCEVYH